MRSTITKRRWKIEMSKKNKKKKDVDVSPDFTYDYVSQQGKPIRAYEEIKQPINTSGMASISTGWALIFGVLLPVFLWWMLQYNIMGLLDQIVNALSMESMRETLPFLPFVLTLITLIVCLIVRAKGSAIKYKVQDTMIVQMDRKDRKKVCKLLLRPGMSVSLRRTLKGAIFGYADVVINVAIGADHGEVILHDVKKYKMVAKMIKDTIKSNGLMSTRSTVYNV